MTENRNWLGHTLGLITMLIWGTTFIATKVLLTDLTPLAILFYRFSLGYLALWLIHPRPARFRNLKEELLFAGLGLTGIALYYLLENSALQYTLAANAGLIIAVAPMLTGIIAHFGTRDERLRPGLVLGFLSAMTGVFLVIFNGSFVLRLNPLGDALALLAALVWAVYSVLLKRVDPGVNPIVAVRKSFFYGLLVITPLLVRERSGFRFGIPEADWPLVLNLLFLGLAASALCFVMWGRAVRLIGAIAASNYIYLVPLITMLTSMIALRERVNQLMLLGGLLILGGVYLAERGAARNGVVKPRAHATRPGSSLK
jgi:drug/metabolite transporter (DMT)-like permease